MIIDTHVHYNLEPLFSNDVDPSVWKDHWEKAQQHDVKKSIIVGTDYFTSKLANQLASKDKNLYSAVGCHPNFYHEAYVEAKTQGRKLPEVMFEDVDDDIAHLAQIVKDEKVVAVGETGLDYYRLPSDGDERQVVIEVQKLAFREHITLAVKHHLPLICHVRDKETPEKKNEHNAYWDALQLLQELNVKNFTLHCVSGPKAYVQQAIEMGGYMGFDGNITYPKADGIRDIFKLVPKDRRLLETDAPYLPPQPFRGKICEPWMIEKTVEYIESELKVDRQGFATNAERIFEI